MEEKQRKHQREETAKWVMKYSVVHDGFYYKHKETKELSWEDPRLALLDQSDMEAFLTTRNSLRSSMRSEAIQQQYHTRESNANTAIHTLINDKNYVNTIAEGEEHNDEKSESNSGGSLAKEKGRNAVLWKEKFSTEYGLNY